jgi:hypothetical protein
MRPRSPLTVFLLLCVASVPVVATVLVSMDLTELVSRAGTVVYGRVVETRAVVVEGRTETIVTLGVPSYLKGEGGREVEFRVPGGLIGRYRTVVVGAPVLSEGDEVVAFLIRDAGQIATVVGFSQGVLKVSRRGSDATPMVLSPPISRDGRAQRIVRGDGAERFVPLATLVQDVRALAVAAARDRAQPDRRTPAGGKTGGR